MKRILAVFVVMSLALSLAGAFGEDEGVTRIVFWHSASEIAGEKLEKYVKEFNDTIGAEKGIFVEAVYQGSYSDASGKMNSLLSAENYSDLPDVMQLDATGKQRYMSASVAYTAQEAFEDHPDDKSDDFFPVALGNWNLDGVQLGLTFATSTTVTFYNASVLDEAPQTFEDIADIAAYYDIEDGVEIFACVPNTPLLANWIGQLGGSVVDGANGSEATATRLDCIDDGTLLSFLESWKALYESGALTNRAASSDEFVSGRLLVMTGSTSTISSLLDRIGGRFELGIAPFIRVNDEAQSGATVSGSCLVMFNHSDARAEAAWELVKYLTSAPVQADFAAATGYIPSRLSAVDEPVWQSLVSDLPIYAAGLEQLTLTPESMRSVTVGPAADFYYTIQDTVSAMLTDDLTPEETLIEMERELNGLLERYLKANG